MSIQSTAAVDVEDIVYATHAESPLELRLFRPRGAGPFPGVVEVHAGAWCNYDKSRSDKLNERLAALGIVVAAIDFRMPPEAPYPASIADVNYAIRWLKANAADVGAAPGPVGVLGSSTGAHQAMLSAMRPRDPRYAALPLASGPGLTADVACVVALWPVIDPLARYRYAQELEAAGEEPEITAMVLPGHDDYWLGTEAMAEGNPVLILERGEAVDLPPVLYVQCAYDVAHPRRDLDRFVSLYRAAGGFVELDLVDAPPRFLLDDLDGPASIAELPRIAEFVRAAVEAPSGAAA